MPVWPERAEAADAADGVDAIQNRVWLGPLVDGAYDERLRALAPPLDDSAVVRDGDLSLVQGLGRLAGRQLLHAGAGRQSAARARAASGWTPRRTRGSRVSRFAPRPPAHRHGLGGRAARGLEELLVEVHAAHRSPPRRHRERRRLRRRDARRGRLGRRPGPHRLPARAHRGGRASARRRRGRARPMSRGRCSTTSSGPRATRRSSGSSSTGGARRTPGVVGRRRPTSWSRAGSSTPVASLP